MASRGGRKVCAFVPAGVDALGVRLGAAALVVVLASSATPMWGCGACWPGSCRDPAPTPAPTGPTPTPTSTPDPEPECRIDLRNDDIDENLWERPSEGCPRLLLDPDEPNYDAADICESGVYSDEGDDTFLFRFSCNAGAPWNLVPATEGTYEDDAGGELPAMVLVESCEGVLPQSEKFAYGRDLERLLWGRHAAEIGRVVSDWEDACGAPDATDEQLAECAAVCAAEKSLRKALADGGIETTPEVDCYLALFDSFPIREGTVVEDEGGTLSLKSLCGCRPTPDFAACLAGETETGESCFGGAQEVDPACEELCWTEWGDDEGECTLP